MKTYLVYAILLVFCSSYSQSVNLTVATENFKGDTIAIIADNFHKVIRSKGKGIFNGAFSIQAGIYKIKIGNEISLIYLKNGKTIQMKIDVLEFDESIKFSGDLSAENSFLSLRVLSNEAFEFDFGIVRFDPEGAEKVLQQREEKFSLLVKQQNYDVDFVKAITKIESDEIAYNKDYISKVKAMKALKGQVSPGFRYRNMEDKEENLNDFRGKYVFIDLWATWCGPCLQEIPHVQKLQKKYAEKNITFVSISLDTDKDANSWKNMIVKKQMTGTQLRADKAFDSDFMKAYFVDGIPRFIIIDPNGIVVNVEAMPPSHKELEQQLDLLLQM